MNTDSRRKAAATYAEKRKAEGWAKRTVWLSPAAQKRLDELAKLHGSRDAALNAILAPPATTPAKAPKKAATGQKTLVGYDVQGEPIYR